jgi:hypothetical protein
MNRSMENLEMSYEMERFLYSEGSEDHDREVACSLQYQKATYESGESTARTGNNTDSKYYYDL